jgi:hypothetical protein
VVCGEVIDECVLRLQKYCSNRKCKWEYFDRIRKQIRSSRERKRERLKRQARDLRDSAAEAAGIRNPKDFTPVAIPLNMRAAIPLNMRRVRHLPEKRRRTFCNRLMQMIGQAAAERRSSTPSKDNTTIQMNCDAQMQGTELRSVLRNACAICRGSCCINGGDHAYIKVETLLRYMHQHPELQQHQVLEEYLSCLSKKTYEDSCIYHTKFGCALPRDMRAETCNSFACEGLVEIKKHTIDTKSTRFFIATMEGEDILWSAFVDGESNPAILHILLVD